MVIPMFGTLIRSAREARGLTLREAARMVGLDPSHLWRIERGDRPPPPLQRLRSLAQVLDLSLADLIVAGGTPKEVVESLLWSGRLTFGGPEAFSPYHPDLWRRNTFLAPVMSREGARVTVQLGEENLTVLSFSQAERLWLVVPPETVMLLPGTVPPALEANVLPVRVEKTRRLGELVNLVLAGQGFELNALSLSAERAGVGSVLRAGIPPAAVRTLPWKEGAL